MLFQIDRECLFLNIGLKYDRVIKPVSKFKSHIRPVQSSPSGLAKHIEAFRNPLEFISSWFHEFNKKVQVGKGGFALALYEKRVRFIHQNQLYRKYHPSKASIQ